MRKITKKNRTSLRNHVRRKRETDALMKRKKKENQLLKDRREQKKIRETTNKIRKETTNKIKNSRRRYEKD